ncbi:phage tail sheath family protein [Sporosarcina sp. FSL K6-1508]|uniref:phage tail sheath family protein n=1 Tax=Sporosarcina sp. FSL K6-1508 TaxID=2921553 RepID=UPI0030F8DC0B
MAYNHGITILENPTSIIPPIQSSAGIQVVIGTAPVNMVADPSSAVNKPILATDWKEATEKVGYSDDWEQYTLCQSMDATFRVFNVAPIIFINVLDPARHFTQVDDAVVPVKESEGLIKKTGILLDSISVKVASVGYQRDKDFSVGFDRDGFVVITILDETGDLASAAELDVSYKELDPAKVTENDIVGGYDVATGKYEGSEVIDQVYPRLNDVPGLILAPGWSHLPVVAAVIDAKSRFINSCFNAMNVLDIDSGEVKNYQDAPTWKSMNSYTSKDSIICWPKARVGNKVYWMSALVAAQTAFTDAINDDVPYVSPSNKRLPITGTLLADGTEVFLDQLQGNFLNGAGIVTAINMKGWRTWGNNTGAYPSTSDIKDRFVPVRRMFNWWGNTFIQTYFDKVDDPTNLRLIESVVDSENIRGNGLQSQQQIAGAKIEFLQKDNPVTNLLNGRIQFLQKVAFFPPAEHIVNVLEFDPTILNNALFGGD